MKNFQRMMTLLALVLTAACGGGSSTTTPPATVTNTAPVARVGADQSVGAKTLVTLDGSASSDANSDALSYAWTLGTKPIGSLATLSSATLAKPTFTADESGTYVASLVVSDGKASSNAASTTVTVPTVVTAAGTLDATFGSAGKAISTYSTTSTFGPAVKVQTDGRIVVVGKQFNGHDDDILVQRFYSNGLPDTSFGTGGAAVLKLSSGDENAKALVIQSDGKIVIAGGAVQFGSYETSVVLRLTADGVLDSSFGSGGKVLIDFGVPSHAHAVVLQSDGKVVMTGETYTTSDGGMFALARLQSNGALDTSFGTGGKVSQVLGTGGNGHALAVQSDGKVVVGGYATSTETRRTSFAVLRFSSTGVLDTSFGSGGTSLISVGTGNNYCHALLLQSDGKIVLSGGANTATNFDFALVRLNINGTLDTSFGSGGTVTTNFVSGSTPSIEETAAAIIQTDGKIVAGGYSDRKFAVVRYLANGSVDTSFGTAGMVTTVVGSDGDDWIKSMALQSWDGKIIAAGYSKNGTNFNLALTRYSGGVP